MNNDREIQFEDGYIYTQWGLVVRPCENHPLVSNTGVRTENEDGETGE
jgi:hypothetical protein